MTLGPDPINMLARARADLRMGVPLVLQAKDCGAVAFAVETLSQARFLALQEIQGDACLAITGRRALTLQAMAYDGDMARIKLPQGVALSWLKGIADPSDDLASPMKGPFQTLRDGDTRLHRMGLALVKSARLLPAVVVVEIDDAAEFALQHGLTLIAADNGSITPMPLLREVVSATLPLAVSEAGRLHVFRPDDGGEEHYAIEIGQAPRNGPVLARLHSACFTGDLMGSLKCDCGPQLRSAMVRMGAEGAGILLYLNQEGRGIGLANKMRAYSLQDQGFDTVEANHRLGFEDDERDFKVGAEILKKLGFSSVRLMTNNPAKVARMENSGIKVVERVPLKVGENSHNRAYLATKADKSGHLL